MATSTKAKHARGQKKRSAPPSDTVPAVWPGPFGLYTYSRAAVRLNVGLLVTLLVLTALMGGITELSRRRQGSSLLSLVFNSLVMIGLLRAQLAGVRGRKLTFNDAFDNFLPLWVKMIGLTILVDLSYLLSIVLLIVPFFFVFPRLTLASYFLIDQNMSIIEAYKASWAATRGNALKIWGIIGVTILILLLILTIIGIPFALYFYVMYSAALAIAYVMFSPHAATTARGRRV